MLFCFYNLYHILLLSLVIDLLNRKVLIRKSIYYVFVLIVWTGFIVTPELVHFPGEPVEHWFLSSFFNFLFSQYEILYIFPAYFVFLLSLSFLCSCFCFMCNQWYFIKNTLRSRIYKTFFFCYIFIILLQKITIGQTYFVLIWNRTHCHILLVILEQMS